MKLAAIVRPPATVTLEGAGIGVEELRAAALEQQPADHELAQLLVHSGRVDGNLVGTGIFRPTTTRTIEADDRDYPSARYAQGAGTGGPYRALGARSRPADVAP
ncbi:hypothetical protein [Plantibacter sp. Leaf314]|uniref:hypothetical protein n=1 Tax=Plantibacter sp. Leaf314 TaxID=1736333 RepID=UPI0012FA450A|nr:hypothetical protein [Plantibacter sp. Leaf314]